MSWKGKGNNNQKLACCKGFAAVIGTCDAARERETSKELINLLNQAIEAIKEQEDIPSKDSKSESIQDLLNQELSLARGTESNASQEVVSIHTGIKGIVLIKINNHSYCPINLVKSIFDRVKKEKLPCSRHVVRVIPLQKVFFPNEEELNESISSILNKELQVEDSNDSSLCVVVQSSIENSLKDSTETLIEINQISNNNNYYNNNNNNDKKFRKFAYDLTFKARNHTTLNKQVVLETIKAKMPTYARHDFRNPEVFNFLFLLFFFIIIIIFFFYMNLNIIFLFFLLLITIQLYIIIE
jgi:hypothetical protein